MFITVVGIAEEVRSNMTPKNSDSSILTIVFTLLSWSNNGFDIGPKGAPQTFL